MARKPGRGVVATILAAAFAFAGTVAACAGDLPILTLSDATNDVQVRRFLRVDPDARRAHDVETLRKGTRTAGFVPFMRVRRSLRSTGMRYWFMLELVNRSSKRDWFLAFLPTSRPDTELYIPDGGGGYRRLLTSAQAPFSERLIKHRYIVAPLEIPSGEAQTLYLHMVARQQYSMGVWSYQGFLKHSRDDALFLGLFYGIAIAMALYNFFLFLRLRDTSYLYYTLFVLVFTLVLAYQDGTAAEYLNPRGLGASGLLSMDLFANLTAVFAFLFVWRFLGIRRYSRLLSAVFLAFVGFYGLLSTVYVVLQSSVLTIIASAGAIAGLALFFVAIAYVLSKGFRPAQYLLYGMAPPLIATLAFGLNNLGLMIPLDIIVPSIYVSFILAALLFSLALADRINLLRVEQRSIERVNLAKTEFFVNLAHEVKTPLMVISNYLDSYLARHGDSPELSVMKRAVETLTRDMVQFFDVARLEKGINFSDERIACDLSALTAERVALFSQACDERGLALRSDIAAGLFAAGDPTAIHRVVDNLIENAIRYNRDGGAIDVTLHGRAQSVVLEVADTGIGIEPESLSRIFAPYYQVSHSKRGSQGIGMGLTLVGQIMSSLGGTIQATSQAGRGSTFTAVFPAFDGSTMDRNHIVAAVADGGRGEAPAAEVPSAAHRLTTSSDSAVGDVIGVLQPDDGQTRLGDDPLRLTVLVVEDNPELLTLMAARLEEHYRVVRASNGGEALESLNRCESCSLVVADIMMEGMDGYELLERLKDNPLFEKIPCILISARTSHEERMTGLARGAIDYIYKPFSVDELLLKVDAITRHQRIARSRSERERMVSLRALVSGFSHEIANPLSGITGALDNLRRRIVIADPREGPRLRKYFDFALESVRRIDDVTTALRLVAQQRAYAQEDLHIAEIAESILRQFRSAVPDTVRLTLAIDGSATMVGDLRAARLVLRNLVANAIDALPERGEVTVTAMRDGSCTALSIRDTGVGMTAEVRGRMFEPFFTQKEPGTGMGIGLFLVRRMCLDMNWDISVRSSPGRGTTVTLVAPDRPIPSFSTSS